MWAPQGAHLKRKFIQDIAGKVVGKVFYGLYGLYGL